MNTTDAADFIADRALTLTYEAGRFPQAAPMARTWLLRALNWAGSRRQFTLRHRISEHLQTLECVRSES